MRSLVKPRLLLAALCIGVVTSGCALLPVPGDAPLRYRDAVFSNVTKTADVVYGSAVDQLGVTTALKLDVYQPAGDTLTRRPLIIWVHGGSFRALDKQSPELLDETSTFALKGYVNASIDYRLAPHGCTSITVECLQAIADAREDAQAAVRFFRANAATYGVDPTRIAIAGTSAGAITALNVAYESDNPGNSGNPGYSSAVRAAVSLSGAAIPSGAIDSHDNVAALLFHGTVDPLVPYTWADATANAATAAGLTSYLITWPGEGHVPYLQHRDEILDLTSNFLYRTLDVAGA
jgi:acetyl esterase/lipase